MNEQVKIFLTAAGTVLVLLAGSAVYEHCVSRPPTQPLRVEWVPPVVNCQGCKWNSEWTLWVNPPPHPRLWEYCAHPGDRLGLWRKGDDYYYGVICGSERVTTTTTTTSLPPPEPVAWPCEDFTACGHRDWHHCGESIGCGGRCLDREGWDCQWDCKRAERW